MRSYDAETQQNTSSTMPSRIERKVPTDYPWMRIQTVTALALGVGFVMFLATGLIAIGYGWPIGTVCILTGTTMALVLVLGLCQKELYDILYHVETITRVDFDGNGLHGRPPIPTTQVFLPKADSTGVDIFKLPVELELLSEWCAAAVNQVSLAVNLWSPRFTSHADITYKEFLYKLEMGAVVTNVGGNVGYTLNRRNPQALQFVRFFIEALTHLEEIPTPVEAMPQIEGPRGLQ